MRDGRRDLGSEPGLPVGAVSERVDALVERGLEKYGAGDLTGALAEWEHALSLDGAAPRAAEYIEYVKANFAMLETQFREARAVAEQSLALGVPMPLIDEETSGAYDMIELGRQPTPVRPTPLLRPESAAGQIESRFSLNDKRPTPPSAPPAGMARHAVKPASLEAALSDVAAGNEAPGRTRDMELRVDDMMTPVPGLLPERPAGDEPALELADEETVERHARAATDEEDYPELELSGGDDDRPESDEGSSLVADEGSFSTDPSHDVSARPTIQSLPPRMPRMSTLPSIPFSDDDIRLAPHDTEEGEPVVPAAVAAANQVHEVDEVEEVDEVDDSAGTSRPNEDSRRTQDILADIGDPKMRTRVMDLVVLARDAADRGDYRSAVEAVETASAEDPEGGVAPVILHRYRDLLYRIYEGHLGNLEQVPSIAAPLHEIAGQSLDHRTGFLLSRIDGVLTFEDILDVAGMPRMEAYKILSGLLRRGFIDVR